MLLEGALLGRMQTQPERIPENPPNRGQAALDQLAGSLKVDLVILDQDMPGLSGTDTLQLLRKSWPLLLESLDTGYLDPTPVAQASAYPRAQVLRKPYARLELSRAIREIMAQETPVNGARHPSARRAGARKATRLAEPLS